MTLNNTVTGPGFQTVQYMGGPFVIDAAGRAEVIDLSSRRRPTRVHRRRSAPPCWCNTFSNGLGCHYVQHPPGHHRVHRAGRQADQPGAARDRPAGLGSRRPCRARHPERLPGQRGPALRRRGGLPARGELHHPAATSVTAPGLDLRPAPRQRGPDQHGGGSATACSTAVDARGRPLYRSSGRRTGRRAAAHAVRPTATPPPPPPSAANALDNIAHFTDQPRAPALFAECASLDFEGSYEKRPDNRRGVSAPQRHRLHPLPLHRRDRNQRPVARHDNWDGRNCTDPDYLARPARRPSASSTRTRTTRSRSWATSTTQPPSAMCSSTGRTQLNGSSYQPGAEAAGGVLGGLQRGAFSNAADRAANATAGTSSPSGRRTTTRRRPPSSTWPATPTRAPSPGNRIVLNTLLNLGSNRWARSAPSPRRSPSTTPTAADADGHAARCWSRPPTRRCPATCRRAGHVRLQHRLPVGASRIYPGTPARALAGRRDALAQGGNDLDAAALWDADATLPPPGDAQPLHLLRRRGDGQPGPGGGRLAPQRRAPGGLEAESGLTPTAINDNYSAAPNPGCVDVLRYGSGRRTGIASFGLVPGADGICDLQQAIAVHPA